MHHKILIPTDFSIESLNCLKWLLTQKGEGNTYDVTLLYGHSTSDSITELLFFSKSRMIASLENKNFRNACKIIKNKFGEQINSLRVDLFTGFTQSAFQSYIEANAIDMAVIPGSYTLQPSAKGSIDLIPFIQKSGMAVTEVDWESTQPVPEKGKLAEVLFGFLPS